MFLPNRGFERIRYIVQIKRFSFSLIMIAFGLAGKVGRRQAKSQTTRVTLFILDKVLQWLCGARSKQYPPSCHKHLWFSNFPKFVGLSNISI